MTSAEEALESLNRASALLQSKRQTTQAIELIHVDDDYGVVGANFHCPSCNEHLRWTAYAGIDGGTVWDNTCACGLTWRIEITAIGEPSKEG